MEYIIPVDKWFDPKVGSRSKPSLVRKINSELDQEYRIKLKESCFGKLLEMEEVKFSSKLMNSLLLRRIARKWNRTKPVSNDEELWFKIGDETLCFSLTEFTLITGLNPGKEENYTTKIPKENRLLDVYFEGAESVTPKTLKEAFKNAKVQEDKYKLGLVLIYESVLRAKEAGTSIEVENLAIVDDLELFDEYPWGRKSYKYTIHGFLRKMASPNQYSLWGFPTTLQVWAFECIPDLVNFFDASKFEEKIPRMCSWKSMATPSHSMVESVLKNLEIKVNSLKATSEEIKENYMKIFFEEPSHESGNMNMSPHRESIGEEIVSPQMSETDSASLEKMHEDEIIGLHLEWIYQSERLRFIIIWDAISIGIRLLPSQKFPLS